MGKKALSGRGNWQTESGPGGLAGTAEKDLYKVFVKPLMAQTMFSVSILNNLNIYMKVLSCPRKFWRRFIARM